MTTTCQIHPSIQTFPPATHDLSTLTGTETALRLTAKVKGFERLTDLPDLRTLWCFNIDTTRLEIIRRCKRLKTLYIEAAKTTKLGDLGQLSDLKILSIDGASKVDSLDWLAHIPPLTQLRIQHFPRLDNLKALRFQPDLHVLEVSGSLWTSMRVESFQPIGNLAELRILYLTNIHTADGSLRPLAKLKNLDLLVTAGFHDWQEFAALSAALPDTQCSWFAPFVAGTGRCESCGTDLVMPTGRGQRQACPQCKRSQVEAHVLRFQNAAQRAHDSN